MKEEEKVEGIKEVVKSTIKKTHSKVGDKVCTVIEYAGMTGINSRLKFWLRKKYDNKETRTAEEWYKELLKENAISEKPAILDQLILGSK